MKKQWLVGTLLVLVAGCDVVLGIPQAPPLQEDQACRKWMCTGKTPCGYENKAPGTTCPTGVCDNAGECRSARGTPCSAPSDCATDQCADGVCCESACTESCKACNANGQCVNVVKGADDANSDQPCVGAEWTCNGDGLCKKDSGQACGDGSDCVTGHCADGVCCNEDCNDTCKACNLPGSVGTCTNIASGQHDENPFQSCAGSSLACDGQGACKGVFGASCSGDGKGCASGNCVDDVCCDDPCSGTCMACNLPGTVGTCQKIPSGQQDPIGANACNGSGETCDGSGNCKLTNGNSCGSPSDCFSGNCVDGVCCDTQCNGTCNACTVSAKKQGIDGQCGPIALGWDPGNECTNGACDGIGGCKLDLGQQCFTGSECLSGQCVDGVCCNNACAGTCMACNAGNGICKYVALNLDPQNECSNGACGGNGACKKDIGQTCATDGDCLSNACSSKGVCMGPSCSGLAETCGSTQKENCCASSVVVGGTYDRDRWGGYAATLSDFRLDRFEATVGRFRKFVAAYPGSKPIGGAGAHPLITNSGWNTAWNLPGNQADLIGSVKGCTTPTWTDLADPTTDNRPINCVTWEVAFAFCAWDGGRLPTAAEWGFAATGGNSQAIYPWSTNATDCSSGYAVFNCQEGGNPIDCFLGDIRPVGWKPGGNSPGQQADMGGSMREWNLDYSGLPMPCNNCANLTNLGNSARVLRGGSWMSPYKVWNQQFGTQWVPEMDTLTQTTVAEARTIGLRCARTP